MRKFVKIISLDELITSDFNKVILTLAELITKKNSNLSQNESIDIIKQILQKKKSNLDKFNRGEINEEYFTEKMVLALQKATGVLLTFEEIDLAWSTQFSEFITFQALLDEASYYNMQKHHQLIFVFYTNPKEIRYIKTQLDIHCLPYQIENNILREINGIPIYLSYVSKQSYPNLIALTIKNLNPFLFKNKSLLGSFFKIFSNKKRADITYIRCKNKISDPLFKSVFDQQSLELTQTLKNFSIYVRFWDKSSNSLTDVLNDSIVNLSSEMSTSTTKLCS